MKYANGTTTTRYATKYYNTDGTTPVKHIYAGSLSVATVKGTGASAAVFAVHNDHLSGSNVVTNSGGTQEEVMDYFPYGNIRIDQKAGSFDEQRKFSGHEYDADTQLSYMNARYYKSDIGRFISQDPLFYRIEDMLKRFGADPQGLNSYCYVNNNPLKYTDPTGEVLVISDAAGKSFVTKTYQSIYKLHPGTGLMKVDGGYQVKINGVDRIDDTNRASSTLITNLVNSDKTVTIKQGDENKAQYLRNEFAYFLGLSADSDVYYNSSYMPAVSEIDGGGNVVSNPTPAEIGLGHELIHGLHYAEGTQKNGAGFYQDLSGQPAYNKKEELQTVGGFGYERQNSVTENQLREERGYNRRNR